MGAAESTEATHDGTSDGAVATPAADGAAPMASPRQQFSITLKDMKVGDDDGSGGLGKGGSEVWGSFDVAGKSDDALSAASTRSQSVQRSFRVTKPKKKVRVGVTLESHPEEKIVRIANFHEGSMLQSTGAQVGDVVVSVNGTAVTDCNQATEIIKKSVGDVEVVIEREEPVVA